MSDLNKYLKLLLSDLNKFDEIPDKGVRLIVLQDYKNKLQNINSNYTLSTADMKIVSELSIKIKQLDEKLGNKVINTKVK